MDRATKRRGSGEEEAIGLAEGKSRPTGGRRAKRRDPATRRARETRGKRRRRDPATREARQKTRKQEKGDDQTRC